MTISGVPQASPDNFEIPGRFNSDMKSRTPDNSPAFRLYKELKPNRNSLTVEVERRRVLESIAWCTWVFTLLVRLNKNGDSSLSPLQLYRPNQLDLGDSVKSIRCINWSLSTMR